MANRYTNLTPSAYSPLSLEEIAMVPAMKRKQHDALLAQQETIKSGLAKVDPYKKHFDEAMNLKRGIEGKIDQTATELAESGINQDMIGKTIALNREYQDLIAPTGKLGQINAEKLNISKINEEYDKMAAAQHWSPAESEYWKSKALDEYNDLSKNPIYDESGKLVTYKGPTAAPLRIDYAKKMDEYASNAKVSTTEFANAAQELATAEQTGGLPAVIGSSFSRKYGSNAKRVLDAYLTMKREMLDPTSDVHKSMIYERRDPANLLETMKQQSDIYKQTISATERGSTLNPISGGKGDEEKPAGDIISNESTLSSDSLDYKTYEDSAVALQKLEAKPADQRTALENSKIEDLKSLREDTNRRLVGNKELATVLDEKNKIFRKLEEFGAKYNRPRKRGMTDREYASELSLHLPTGTKESAAWQSAKMVEKLRQLDNKYNDIKNKAWNTSSSMRHNYSYMPKTPKEEGIWNLHNENIYNTLKGSGSLGNLMDLTSIHTTGGTRKDLNPKDTENVHELIKTADPKSFKISNIKTYGDGRTPEVTMSFNTTKGAPEYDIEGATDWNDEYGGEEAPVTVTFKLKKFSNVGTKAAPGYKSLSGAIADFWKNKGGVNQVTGNFQGTEVSNALIENEYSDLSNEQLKALAQVDSDAREALYIRKAKHDAAKKGK